jgi:hypothetical protein
MEKNNLKRSVDIIPILKILKEEEIFSFESNIPYFLTELSYDFLWRVLYKAKILSKYKEKRGIDIIDIKIALTLQLKQNNLYIVSVNQLKYLINIINTESFPKKKNKPCIEKSSSYKSIEQDNYKVICNPFV